ANIVPVLRAGYPKLLDVACYDLSRRLLNRLTDLHRAKGFSVLIPSDAHDVTTWLDLKLDHLASVDPGSFLPIDQHCDKAASRRAKTIVPTDY
ncbi:hypothetical protein, partial [Pseudomonas viridiflava]|uniref:hypothetical protein n=1 Tax=Pseudomonas viridiflava TaxID=33069 RepID=UPI00197E43BB